MFEVHGWITIRYHTHDIDEHKQSTCWLAVKRYVEKFDKSDRIWLIETNGLSSVAISALHNHYQDYPIAMMNWVAANAPGSYGLLYVHDDESVHDNAFRVWRLARGHIDELDDPFLSPCIPFVSDPYDASRDKL